MSRAQITIILITALILIVALSGFVVLRSDSNISTKSDTDTGEFITPFVTSLRNILATDSASLTTMAWVYPGEPACKAEEEYSDGRVIEVLKPEYFTVAHDGALRFLGENTHGCNGFSEESLSSVKAHSLEQYVTISSVETERMKAFFATDEATNEYTNELTAFVVDNTMTGVEIDFEDFGGWDAAAYDSYKQFVDRLGTSLHENGKKLIIDGPPVSNETEEQWYVWRYEDFNSLPVDYITVMAYDYQFDHGVGQPVSPLSWLEDVITWTKNKVKKDSKIVIGLPSYGYRGLKGTHQLEILTFDQMQAFEGAAEASRDANSGELLWEDDQYTYVFQDAESLEIKRDLVKSKGIRAISVWHLGGNPWFPLP